MDFANDPNVRRGALMQAMQREPQQVEQQVQREADLVCPKCKYHAPKAAFEMKEPSPDFQDGPDSVDMGDDYEPEDHNNYLAGSGRPPRNEEFA